MTGLLYARGLVAHHLELVGSLVNAAFDRRVFDPRYFQTGNWTWRRLPAPVPSRNPQFGKGFQLYEKHLEGKELLQPMGAVEQYLTVDVKTLY